MLRRSSLFLAVVSVAFLGAGVAAAQYYVTDLGVLPGGTKSYAMAVNDSGVVAGAAYTSTGAASACATIFTNGAWQNIAGSLDPGRGTFATGINDSGQVAMWERGNTAGTATTLIYNISTASYKSIAAQPGVCNGATNQVAYDPAQSGSFIAAGPINSSGEIAGHYANTNGNESAFLWNGSSTTQVISPTTAIGYSQDYASGINDAGVVIGWNQQGIDPIGNGYYNIGGTPYVINGMTYPECIAGNKVVGTDYYYNYNPNYLWYQAAVYTLGATPRPPLAR